MPARIYLAALAALLLTMTACVKYDPTPTPKPSRVLLVYVGTDNNLSGLEQEKLDALCNGWTGKPTDHIIVYRDTQGADARLIEISNLAPGELPREIAAYGRENSASGDVFSRVINDVISQYKADSYGLLIFSHASGWLPAGALNNPNAFSANSPHSRSIITDGTSEMALADFASAIPDGVFDYIVFEACFMAGIEVAYELRHKADCIFASSAEIVHPGFAPVYSSATGQLFGQRLEGFGQRVFNHTLTYAGDSPQRSAAYSVIHTAALESLSSFIGENCDFSQSVKIGDIQHFDRNAHRLFFDFEDYYGRLLPNDAKRAELSRLVAACIQWKAATDEFMTQQPGYNGFQIEKHSGLTTYIPQPEFPALNAAYNNTSWAKAIDINLDNVGTAELSLTSTPRHHDAV